MIFVAILFLVSAFGFFASLSREVNIAGMHAIVLRKNKYLSYAVLGVLLAGSLVIYSYYGNSLRSINQGGKGAMGALGFLLTAVSQVFFLYLSLMQRKFQMWLMLPILFFNSNGTFGYLFFLGSVVLLMSFYIRISMMRFVALAPAGFLLLLGLVFYSKQGSVANLVQLMSSDYKDTVVSRIYERVNIFNHFAGHQIENPHSCNFFELTINEYKSGFIRLGLLSGQVDNRSFTKCIYRHFADHEINPRAGASLGFMGSILDVHSILSTILVLVLLCFLLIAVEQRVRQVFDNTPQRWTVYLLVVIFFIPLLDSPPSAFQIFQVSGLKLVTFIALFLLVTKFRKRDVKCTP